ncbi:MAG: peroxide stress protein YaaA, partial [Oscillospiraceae bacterium]|nr:peroxide stress protein YaaA [Oscillospiraceae bacterium]
MIAILSPAMNMAQADTPHLTLTKPVFQKNANKLAKSLQAYSLWELESLLNVNPQLALRAYEAYQNFGKGTGSPAILSFYGLAYQNLNAQDFSA